MHPMLNIAIQAIRQAGNFITKQYVLLNTRNMDTKQKNNLLIKINNKTNQLIIDIIKKYYPSHTIIVKDNNRYITNKTNNEIQWIINSLDSYTHFIKSFPYFSLSIAAQIKGETEIAVVYDPIHHDLFSASKGQGAQLNGCRIRNANHNNPCNTIIAIDIPYQKQIYDIMISILNKHSKYKKTYPNFHCNEAIALNLAYVATGRIDAIFTTNIKTYNLTSGSLLIQESGGLVSNIKKYQNTLTTNNMIIAGNPKLIRFILSKISLSTK